MVSLKNNKQSGFTIVELLIVIIIIGILAGLVITQILGANQKARDTERKTDLNGLTNQLETYFAKSAGYPSRDDLNTAAWRTGNEINTGDANKSLADPGAPTVVTLADAAAQNVYSYIPLPAGCASPTDNDGISTGVANPCTSFTLAAQLENLKDKDARQANGDIRTDMASSAFYVKKSAN
jgi:prepilin-type N-terminal cleavage/methylation domain-containing protein